MARRREQESRQYTEMLREQMSTVLDHFGLYQYRLYLLTILPLIMSGYKTMSVVLIFASPEHRCRVPGLANDSFSIQNDAHRMMVNLSIPMTSSDGDVSYAKCDVYKDRDERHTANRTLYGDTEPCNSWVYDNTVFDNTIATQFDLVCEQKGFRANFNMIYMLGMLVGSSVSGILCDRFGRKMIFMCGLTLSIVVLTATAFPVVTPMLLVYRFLLSALGIIYFMGLFVLMLESMGPEQRTRAASIMLIFWVMGTFVVGGLSYVIRDWRWLQVLNGAPFIFCLSYWWLVDESPRWLLSKGRVQEARKVILKVMKVNKMPVPAEGPLAGDTLTMDDLQQHKAPAGENSEDTKTEETDMTDKEETAETDRDGQTPHQQVDDTNEKKTSETDKDRQNGQQSDNSGKDTSVKGKLQQHSFLGIFKYPQLIARTGILFINWSAISTTYYGLSLYVTNLAGDLRLNFFLSNLVELIGTCGAWFLLDRLGRKRTHCSCMLLSGISCLATIFSVLYGGSELQWLTIALVMVGKYPRRQEKDKKWVAAYYSNALSMLQTLDLLLPRQLQWLTITLVMVGKLGISAAFTIIYLFTGELFPTVIRNQGLGYCSSMARVATALSPYIADLSLHIEGSVGRVLAMVIFGALALTAGLLALCLPETLHRTLPDTILEAATFNKSPTSQSAEVEYVREEEG